MPPDSPVLARRLLFSLLCALLLSCAARSAALSGDALVSALQSGGYVILMRHASSPRTPPDAAHSDPANVQHERQLDDTGRASARAMGDALRRLRIPIGPILSSPTYRALQTARLAGFASPRTFAQLGDQGHSMAADSSGQRGTWLRNKVAEPPPHGMNTFIITHYPNISEAFPADAHELADGEALVFKPAGNGRATLVGRVKIDQWPRWAGLR